MPYGYGARIRPVQLPSRARAGERLRVTVDVENVGDQTWPKRTDPSSAIKLGLRVAAAGAPSTGSFRGYLVPVDVAPGGTARLSIDFAAPEVPGAAFSFWPLPTWEQEDHMPEKPEKKIFRLFKDGRETTFEVISDYHWKVVDSNMGLKKDDEVSPVRRISWREAKQRVNSRRTRLSPNMLALLRGEGYQYTDEEVQKMLVDRTWDPDMPPPAA